MQRFEDEVVLDRAKAEFFERVIAGTVALDPELKLVKAMFPEMDGDNYERTDDGEFIMFPTTDEEFLRLAEEIGLP